MTKVDKDIAKSLRDLSDGSRKITSSINHEHTVAFTKRTQAMKSSLIASPITFALAACGGGGASDSSFSGHTSTDESHNNSTTDEMTNVDQDFVAESPNEGSTDGASSIDHSPFTQSPNSSTVALSYFGDGSERWAVRNFYPSNLDNRSGQEIIIGGAETQPNTPEEYSDTYLSVVTISNGSLVDVTEEIILNDGWQVKGVADIAFGDFNGDGAQDFFSAAGVDMDMSTAVSVFYNSPAGFIREQVELSNFQHGSFSFDINEDGYDDVVAVGYVYGASVYFGSSEGLEKYQSSGVGGASGIALGDFLGNGSVQAVVVDTAVGPEDVSDTRLFLLDIDEDSKTVEFLQIETLPLPRLEREEFADALRNVEGKSSHDIRAETIDFNNDGLMDIVIFSRSGFDTVEREWLDISQIQFLENLGDAQFEDVTDSIMPTYDFNSQVSYEPIFADFNGDGYLDIFSSYASFGPEHNSSVFLLGTEDGTFVEWGRAELSSIVPPDGGMATVISDENNTFWLVVGYQTVGDGGREEILTLYSIDFS